MEGLIRFSYVAFVRSREFSGEKQGLVYGITLSFSAMFQEYGKTLLAMPGGLSLRRKGIILT
jgi:hypothetical protein